MGGEREEEREREGGRERRALSGHGGEGNSHANVPRDCLMEAENGVAPTHGAHARRAPNVCSVFSKCSVRRKMSACVAWRALGFQRV